MSTISLPGTFVCRFYLETASGKVIDHVDGYIVRDESYQYQPRPTEALVCTQKAYTVEVTSFEHLMALVEKLGGYVLINWQSKYPPAPPRQHLPTITVADAPL